MAENEDYGGEGMNIITGLAKDPWELEFDET